LIADSLADNLRMTAIKSARKQKRRTFAGAFEKGMPHKLGCFGSQHEVSKYFSKKGL
jgi:hypothetical protein